MTRFGFLNRDRVPVLLGGIFSVALSLPSRAVRVTDHPTLWSPDFPPRRICIRGGDHPTYLTIKSHVPTMHVNLILFLALRALA